MPTSGPELFLVSGGIMIQTLPACEIGRGLIFQNFLSPRRGLRPRLLCLLRARRLTETSTSDLTGERAPEDAIRQCL